MDYFEVAMEVTDVVVSAFQSYLLRRLRTLLDQRSGMDHSYFS
jgi:hypothetical protein